MEVVIAVRSGSLLHALRIMQRRRVLTHREGGHNEKYNEGSLFWQRIPAATGIINTILPITSPEHALFGVYADVLFSRWRALTCEGFETR